MILLTSYTPAFMYHALPGEAVSPLGHQGCAAVIHFCLITFPSDQLRKSSPFTAKLTQSFFS